MGLEFLARIRRTTLLATVVAALFAAVYVSYPAAVALAAGALWSIANLRLLEAIVTALTAPRRALRRFARNAASCENGDVLLH